MQENFIKACTGKASDGAKITVIAILGIVIAITVLLVILDIRRAIKNRGRIHKL